MIRIMCPKENVHVTADTIQNCLLNGDLIQIDEIETHLYISGAIYLYRHFLKRPHMRPFFERFNKRFKSDTFLKQDEKLVKNECENDMVSCLYSIAPLIIRNSVVLEDETYLLEIRNTFTHLALSDIGISPTTYTSHHRVTNTDPIQCHKMKKELDTLSPHLAHMKKSLNRNYRDKIKSQGIKDINEARQLGLVMDGFVESADLTKETVLFFLDLDGGTKKDIDACMKSTDEELNAYIQTDVPYNLPPIKPTYHSLMVSHSSIAAYILMVALCIGNDPHIKCTFLVQSRFLRELEIDKNNTKTHVLRMHDVITNDGNELMDVEDNILRNNATYIKGNAIDPAHDYSITERLRLADINNLNPHHKDIQYMAEKILTMDVVPPNLLEQPHYGFEWQRRIHTSREQRISESKSTIETFFTAQLAANLYELFAFRQNDLEILYANTKPEHIAYIRESLLTLFCNPSLNGQPREQAALRKLFDDIYQSFAGELLNFYLFNMHVLNDYLADKRETLLKGNHYEKEARRIANEYDALEKTLQDVKNTCAHDIDVAVKHAVKPYEKTIQTLTNQQEKQAKILLEKDVKIRKLEAALREAKDALKMTHTQHDDPKALDDTVTEENRPVIQYTPNQVPYTDDDMRDLNERLNQSSTLIYGGHDKWVQRMREYFPKATVHNPDLLNTDMESLVKKHTTIIVNIHVMNHSGSGRIKEAVRRLKNAGVKRDLLFIDTKSIQRDNLLIAIFDASRTQTDW